MSELPQDLATAVRDARRVEVFTGAGMSADSGLDTFRDATTGLWSHVDPQAMASIDAWARDPEPMWAWYLWRAAKARSADPNPGHTAIADWQHVVDGADGAAGVSVHVTTQNIDDLHGSLPDEPVERLPHRPAQCAAARCVPAWHPCHGDHSGDDRPDPVDHLVAAHDHGVRPASPGGCRARLSGVQLCRPRLPFLVFAW